MAADVVINGRNYFYDRGPITAERYPSIEQPGLWVSRRESLREFGTPLPPPASPWLEFSERTPRGGHRHVFQRGAERVDGEWVGVEWGKLTVGMLRAEMRKALPGIPPERNGTALVLLYVLDDKGLEEWRVAEGGFMYFPDKIRETYKFRDIVELANAWMKGPSANIVDVGAMAIQIAPAYIMEAA